MINKKETKKIRISWLLLIIILSLLLGFTIGIGIGIQEGQYMLFEGLNTALKGANINLTININETQLQTNCASTQKGYCAIKCYENGDLIPCENFTFDEHFCKEGVCEVNGICPTYYEELKGKTLTDCIKEQINKTEARHSSKA